ncbi:MAG: hypothetical protein NXI24_13855 [bacterium]|nr:hypothetical protein [bacterium]
MSNRNRRTTKTHSRSVLLTTVGTICILFGLPGLAANTSGRSEVPGERAAAGLSESPVGAPESIRHPGQAPALFDGIVEDQQSFRPAWDISFYQGKYTRTNLGQILLAGHTKYEPSYISVLTLGRPLPYRLWRANLEGEGQVVRHTGIQKHLEFNGVVMARITEPFRGTPFSLGIGEGLSLATRNPDLENTRRSLQRPNLSTETSRKLLNYLVFEVEMALPLDVYQPRAFVRLHHRSGIFGTLCPSICGSNFVAYGVRFSY